MFFAGVLFCAVGESADHAANLIDDLGVPGAECDVGIGVFWFDRQRVIEAVLDLAAEALGERRGD